MKERVVIRFDGGAHQVNDGVQRVLENSEFAEFGRHKTGHGLGLDVHEATQRVGRIISTLCALSAMVKMVIYQKI